MLLKIVRSGLLVGFITMSWMNGISQPQGNGNRPQGEGEVSGKVLDKVSGKPVEYANILILRERDSVMVTGGTTNIHGAYRITNVPFGRYRLVANFIGFEKTTVPGIMVNPKSTQVVVPNILLQPSAISLQGAEITAERATYDFQIDKKVINVGQDIIAAGGTAVDALANTPSVDVDIEGNVSLRGSGNFTVLVNGRPSVLSGSDALRQIPSSEIKSIEIITNPSAKYDPEGTAGIINVITRKAQEGGLSGVLNAGIGSYSSYKGDFLLNYRTSKFNIAGGMDFRDEHWLGKRTSERMITRNDTATLTDFSGGRDMSHRTFGGNLAVDWTVSPRTTLGAGFKAGSFTFSRESEAENFERTDPATTSYYYVTEAEAPRTRNFYETNLSMRHNLAGAGHRLDAFLYYSSSRSESDDKSTEWLSNSDFTKLGDPIYETSALEEGDDVQARFTLDYIRPVKGGKLEAGFQTRMERDQEDYKFRERLASGGWDDNLELSSATDFYQDIHSGYVTFANAFKGIDYQLGLRAEYTDRATKAIEGSLDTSLVRMDYFPSIHLSRKLKNEHQVQASYSRRINRPRGWDLDPFISYMERGVYRQGNPGLKPEYIDSWELGWLKKWGMTFLTVQGYHRVTTNMITRVLTPYAEDIILHTVENLNKDFSTGAEVMLNMEVNSNLTLNASANLYHYRLEGELYESNVDKESTNWNGRLNSTLKIAKGTRIQVRVGYRGPSVVAQGKVAGMITNELALRQDLLKGQANIVLQVRDPLGTMKRDYTVESLNYYEHLVMRRLSPSFNLAFTYRINNYKPKRDVERGNQEEGGGGGDMDMF